MTKQIRLTTVLILPVFIAVGLLLGGYISTALAAPAATWTVNTLIDEADACNVGDCSLREAINEAAAGDTIVFSVAGTIVLDPFEGDLLIDKDLTIDGGDAITVSGDEATRVFNIYAPSGPVDVTFANITIADGWVDLFQDDCGQFVGDSCGGGIMMQNADVSVTVSNTVFFNNYAEYGGAIENDRGQLTVISSRFEGNFVDIQGGAIESYEGRLLITDSLFIDNMSYEVGGALELIAGDSQIYGTTFDGNVAFDSAGAIDVGDSSAFVLAGSHFENNASSFGAGLYVYSTTAQVRDTIFTHNWSEWFGGGIYVDGMSTLDISSSQIISNEATGGGGIFVYTSTLSVVDSLIDDNQARLGGGIYHTDVDFVFNLVTGTIEAPVSAPLARVNDSRGRAAAATTAHATHELTLSNTLVTSNTAEYGAGVLVEVIPLHIEANTAFVSNTAVNGGGISAWRSAISVDQARFENNSAVATTFGGYGGALFSVAENSLSMTDSLLMQNTADHGGAVYLYNTTTTISDTLFAQNQAGANGGAIQIDGLSTADILSSTISQNGAMSGGGLYVYSSTVTIDGSSLDDNTADYDGGAVYVTDLLSDPVRGVEGSVARRNMLGDFYPIALSEPSQRVVTADPLLTLNNSSFSSNIADSYGGAVYAEGFNVAITTESAFSQNIAMDGGAVYMTAGAIDVTGSDFTENGALASNNGGGAIFSDAPVMIASSTFVSNTTTPVVICELCDGVVGRGGGALHVLSDTVVLSSTFTSNSADETFSGGGAIYARAGLTVTGSQFTANTADSTGFPAGFRTADAASSGSGGGAIYTLGSTTIDDSRFDMNTAEQSGGGGGALYTAEALSVTGSQFNGNSADGSFRSGFIIIVPIREGETDAGAGGGAIYARGTAAITNSLFANNTADDSGSGGGAIYTVAPIDVVRSTFAQNSAITTTVSPSVPLGGGAIYANQQFVTVTLTITNSLFDRNQGVNGGAIYNYNAEVNLQDSAVTNNVAVESGGGLYGRTGVVSPVPAVTGLATYNIDGTTIAGNTAQTVRGGGLYIREGSVANVTNSTISGNSAAGLSGTADDAGNGGGIYIGALLPNHLTLNNVTVTDNRAAGNGGGIDFNRLVSGDMVTLTNTIVAGNSDVGGYPDCYDNGSAGYTLNLNGNNLFGGVSGDVCAGAAGATDLSLNTLGVTITDTLGALADNGGLIAGSDLTGTVVVQTHALLEDSPAVDGGNNSRCEATDQRGVARPIDANNDRNAVCDIGAFEAPQFVFTAFLPMITKNKTFAPDLVVDSVTLGSNDVQVVVKNIGDRSATTNFWVDIYVNPGTVPVGVNDTWEVIGGEGIVWGVTDVTLAPNDSLTLTLSSSHYSVAKSRFSGNIAVGSAIYGHVDSAHLGVPNGNVLESHEILNGSYNNIISMTATTAVSVPNLPTLVNSPHSTQTQAAPQR